MHALAAGDLRERSRNRLGRPPAVLRVLVQCTWSRHNSHRRSRRASAPADDELSVPGAVRPIDTVLEQRAIEADSSFSTLVFLWCVRAKRSRSRALALFQSQMTWSFALGPCLSMPTTRIPCYVPTLIEFESFLPRLQVLSASRCAYTSRDGQSSS